MHKRVLALMAGVSIAGGLACPLTFAQQVKNDKPTAVAAETIPTRHNDRVELLTIVFRLAGSPEFNQPSSASPYAAEVDAYFRGFAGHDVVKLARKYRKENGVSFDAVLSYAVHLSDKTPLNQLEAKISFTLMPRPERFDKRWDEARSRAFVEALNRFVTDSKADKFIADHKTLYDEAAARLAEPVNKRPYRAWLDKFFGAKGQATFAACPGMLCGSGNYGVGVKFLDGRDEITPVFGASKFDAQGVPVYDDSICPTIAHEFCHSHCNPLIDSVGKELDANLEKLFAVRADVMRKQAYGNARTMGYESLVRACTVKFAMENDTPEAAAAQLAEEHARGFLWTGELVELLGVYQADRQRYPTMKEFMPEVAAFFARIAADPQAQLAKVPRIVKSSPANGARAVDPQITELSIEFSRPMQAGYSFVTDGAVMPKVEGKPWWSTDGKTLVLPVKLQKGKSYVLKLNGPAHHGFTSDKGFAMEPAEIRFTTAP